MRLEMRARGLIGTLNVAMYQATFNSFSNSSAKVKDDFDRVVSSFYSLNGGVGNLQSAVSLIQQRVRQESEKQESIQITRQETNKFLEGTVACDRRVASIVSKNDDKFYWVNPHLKPTSCVSISIDKDMFKIFQTGEIIMTASEKCAKSIEETNQYYIENGVYSLGKTGEYGSNQGSPAGIAEDDGYISKREQEFLSIIKRNKQKDMTDNELDDYLDKLNKEGCAYASIVNSIFEYYENAENGEELFEKKFGFTMKQSNGKMNFDLLLVYVYSKYGDSNPKGLKSKSQTEALKEVMAEKGSDQNGEVKVKTKSYWNLTCEEINKYLKEGKQIIISSQSAILYTMDGKYYGDCVGAGHSLSVTGVTPDGKIIVSSWGQQFCIDLKDDGKFHCRKDSSQKIGYFLGWTDYDFTVVEYE